MRVHLIKKHTPHLKYIYMDKPVAIGEHPQHAEEMGKLVDAMAAAQDSLEALSAEYPEVEMNLLVEASAKV